jgi:hypothetical protein
MYCPTLRYKYRKKVPAEIEKKNHGTNQYLCPWGWYGWYSHVEIIPPLLQLMDIKYPPGTFLRLLRLSTCLSGTFYSPNTPAKKRVSIRKSHSRVIPSTGVRQKAYAYHNGGIFGIIQEYCYKYY